MFLLKPVTLYVVSAIPLLLTTVDENDEFVESSTWYVDAFLTLFHFNTGDVDCVLPFGGDDNVGVAGADEPFFCVVKPQTADHALEPFWGTDATRQ